AYFQDFDPQNILMDGLKNKEIDVALDNSKKFLSFIWYERYGAFGMHTYLHMIAVKEKYRRTSDCKDEAYGLVLTFSPKVLTIE
ncbi:MAG: hypothetical protein Q8930_08790, partial [Bacillota bacterium]|nr:hypothetical protein [Bacillota bacterium]